MDEFILTETEKTTLLKTARDVITASLESRTPELPEPEGVLGQACGAFVTLHTRGRLRGCIGHIVARLPLWKTIETMAKAAAFEDPRFPSVSREEMDEIDIEISVLSPLREAGGQEEVITGTHGIYISKGYRAGVLLPQVPVEQGWDHDEYLTHGCYKAGLPGDAWKDPSTKIEIFTAIVFGETDDK